jgi:hypothetical protein
MQMHKIRVLIPEDHNLVVKVPAKVRSGPAELIFVVASESEAEVRAESVSSEALARWDAVTVEMERDPRPFGELSPEERRARLGRLRGSAKGLLSPSEEFARRKREEVEIEDRKLDR